MKRSLVTIACLLAAATTAIPLAATPAAAPPADATGAVDVRSLDAPEVKRAVIEKSLALTPAEAAKFWPIYERYQRELGVIVARQNRALLDYVQAGPSTTNANAERIAWEIVKADGDEQKLRERELRKLLKVLPARKAVRYIQIEQRVRTTVRYDASQRMSLIE